MVMRNIIGKSGEEKVVDLVKDLQRQIDAANTTPAGDKVLEEGEDCKAVVTQLSAVSKALDRAGFAIIASGMEKCLAGEDGAMDRKALEKLFLTLA